ncbi:MAG: hypothetical protein CVU57_20920 [Deltaproteobacteria bacterium HGW-Deltaproteobacteria-15]|nr:MAG: hypothetical protein CVU57_20920 [Deltaproteobacteria bacterium HGW-Deltaproteobacteria-15]PKN99382.1 MAG: hypothetical protein CVU43_15285 [Chloroflexi bacterium HGW-Chloroflexi-5]
MANTVFILGAGASKDAGVPMMGEFLDVAGDLYKRGDVGLSEVQLEFQKVFQGMASLSKAHSKADLDFQNVESIFAAFEMGKLLGGFGDYDRAGMESLVSAMRTLIVKTIEKTMRFPAKPVPPPPYDRLMQLVDFLLSKANPRQTLAFITFNYDLALDVSFSLKGLTPEYGLDSLQSLPVRGAIPLLKLHGSLNWGICPKCKFIVPLEIKNALRSTGWEPIPGTEQGRLEIGAHLKILQHCGTTCLPEPMIVPPTWNKAGYHYQVSPVWARAARELKEAENIFVIGYSLPQSDFFFKYLYGLGTVGEKILRRFWVIDPDPSGEVMSRFEALLGPGARQRFKPLKKTFKDAVSEIQKEFE